MLPLPLWFLLFVGLVGLPAPSGAQPRELPGGSQVPHPESGRIPDPSPDPLPRSQAVPAPPGRSRLILQKVPGRGPQPIRGRPLIPPPSSREPATYVGDTTCLGCHPGQGKNPETSHLGLSRQSADLPASMRGCEGCHGPGSKHFGDPQGIVNPAKLEPKKSTRACLDCHRMQALSDPHDWFFSRHASAGLSCTSCHSIHQSQAKPLLKAPADDQCLSCHKRVGREFRRRSRHPVRETGFHPLRSLTRGKVSCLDCHTPHGSGGHDGMLKDRMDRVCAKCHPSFVGPHRYSHAGSGEAGSCLQCHLPHGSPHRDLLKSRGRATCLQCHVGRATHFPSQGCNSLSCHVDIHGSNQDALFLR